ncbi:MAG: hypothetical protein RDV48_05960 [Candidatus Eremiobacteraeota bacterium]|nr:hypothetical protein [Candidatus Eremiobacteraeota bacterium]
MKRLFASMLISFALMLLCALPSLAGWGGEFVCKSCGYKSDTVRTGQGMQSESTVIYCPACKAFHSVRPSKTGGKGLNPLTGTIEAIYPCPKCKKSAFEIREETLSSLREMPGVQGAPKAKDCITCPMCGKKTLYFYPSLKWD